MAMKGATETFHTAVQKGDLAKVIKAAAETKDSLRVSDVKDSSGEKSILERSNPRSGDRASHLAARHGHAHILKWLLGNSGVDFESANLDGKRPLHEAAAMGHVSCVEFLLSHGVQVDPLKRADWTPLHLASTKTNMDVIKLLLQAGADPSLRNKDGWNAFHIASREGHVDIMKLLLKEGNALWDTVSKNSRTPLHTAALHGRTEAVAFLVERCGYQTDQGDSCGSSPLMDALRAGYVDVARILIDRHKADVKKTDILGRQAVHLVAQTGCLNSLEFLVRKDNISVNSLTTSGKLTPLHLACKEGQPEVVEALLSFGAAINLEDDKGRTPLHIAAGSQQGACIQVLLKHKAEMVRDDNGKLPRDLARQQEVLCLFDGTER